MTATSTRSRVKKWPGYSCILLSRAICFCGCSVQNMACLEIETQLQSTTETETQFSISMQFANLQSQIVYASCKWSWLANVLHRLSRSQGAQDQIATDVIIGRTETKNKIEVEIFVPVRWSLTGPLIQDFGFQSLISKGHTTAAFWVLLRQHGKARVFWVTQFPQTNARYTVNCFTERLNLQVLRILWWTRARLLWSVINFPQKYLASSKEDTSLSYTCIKPGVRFAWWNNSAVIWVILAFQRTTKLSFQKRFLI